MLSPNDQKICSVFGASKPLPGSAEYDQAEHLGKLLGEAGISVVTGGYYGTMEAVSKGVQSAHNPSATTEGVTVPSIFKHRPADGNAYLDKVTRADSLLHRMERLIHASKVYVILPGLVGTMAEFVAVWNEDFCEKFAREPDARRILMVCWSDPWKKFLDNCVSSLGLDPNVAPVIKFVETSEEAAQAVKEYLNA